ncbi:MAG: hypothetical protein WC873_04735 [Candidatus Gracilibacteria bacterium]
MNHDTRQGSPDGYWVGPGSLPEMLDVRCEDFLSKAAAAAKARGSNFLPVNNWGGTEIHPELKGYRFAFYTHPDKSVHGVAVVLDQLPLDGTGPKWVQKLAGHVFRDITSARTWLRTEAKRLADEALRESVQKGTQRSALGRLAS